MSNINLFQLVFYHVFVIWTIIIHQKIKRLTINHNKFFYMYTTLKLSLKRVTGYEYHLDWPLGVDKMGPQILTFKHIITDRSVDKYKLLKNKGFVFDFRIHNLLLIPPHKWVKRQVIWSLLIFQIKNLFIKNYC